jgi:hypothetical protein
MGVGMHTQARQLISACSSAQGLATALQASQASPASQVTEPTPRVSSLDH